MASPRDVDKSMILYHLAKCVEFMHARHLVHGALTPDSLLWFSDLKKWKLIGFGNWARAGEAMHVTYDLRHAAPELILADLGRVRNFFSRCVTIKWTLWRGVHWPTWENICCNLNSRSLLLCTSILMVRAFEESVGDCIESSIWMSPLFGDTIMAST